MASRNQYPGIDPQIIDCIRYHAVRGNIPGMNVEDVEQELMLRVHQRLPQFDPSRSSVRTFVDRIARSGISSLLEASQAKKRGVGIELLSADRMAFHRGDPITHTYDSLDAEPEQLVGVSPEPYLNLRTDLWLAFDRLPAILRTCFLALLDNTVADAARHAGVSRATLYDRIAAIRKRFRATGLHEYAVEPDTFEVFSVSDQQRH